MPLPFTLKILPPAQIPRGYNRKGKQAQAGARFGEYSAGDKEIKAGQGVFML